MKQIVRFDQKSVDSTTISDIVSANHPRLTQIEDGVYLLDVEPTRFTHAYLLLGQSPDQFGRELRYYLWSVIGFFQDQPNQGSFLSLELGSSDYRRNVCEDLGVSMATVFMADSFGLDWTTMSQIPQNRNLSSTRPDFQACTSTGLKYLFEAKGGSSLDYIPKAMAKAVRQVKNYPLTSVSKYAIVSYFSSDSRLFPSTTFVVDPPAPDGISIDAESSRLLHYAHVLRFLGMDETRAAYLKVVAATMRMNQEERDSSAYRRYSRQHASASEELAAASRRESDALDQLRIQNNSDYRGRSLVVQSAEGNRKCEFSMGIHVDALIPLGRGSVPPISTEVRSGGQWPHFASFMSDWTYLSLSFDEERR